MSDRDDLRERIAQVLYDSDFDTEDWADSRRAADAVLAALPSGDGFLRGRVAAVADRIDNHARRPASDPAYSGRVEGER